jgi:hypothetical protein
MFFLRDQLLRPPTQLSLLLRVERGIRPGNVRDLSIASQAKRPSRQTNSKQSIAATVRPNLMPSLVLSIQNNLKVANEHIIEVEEILEVCFIIAFILAQQFTID